MTTIRSEATKPNDVKKHWHDKLVKEFGPFLLKANGDENMAEQLALMAGFCPPSYTGWTICKHCGPMPSYPEMNGAKVVACVWCHTPHRKVMKEIYEQPIERISDLNEGQIELVKKKYTHSFW